MEFEEPINPGEDLLKFSGREKFETILADPPWQFSNRTGKMAPEHKRLSRNGTMKLEDILELPVAQAAAPKAHLYLWVPNALLAEGLEVMKRWGFTYKTNLVWHKVRKDGGSDGRGVGFYFRNVTEMVLFGIRGKALELWLLEDAKLIFWQPGKESIPENPTNFMKLLKVAILDHIWSCLHGIPAPVGPNGVMSFNNNHPKTNHVPICKRLILYLPDIPTGIEEQQAYSPTGSILGMKREQLLKMRSA